MLAVGLEPTTVLRRSDSLDNAIPLLVCPRLTNQAAIGSASTSIRDHRHIIVFGAPLPFRLRERSITTAQTFDVKNPHWLRTWFSRCNWLTCPEGTLDISRGWSESENPRNHQPEIHPPWKGARRGFVCRPFRAWKLGARNPGIASPANLRWASGTKTDVKPDASRF